MKELKLVSKIPPSVNHYLAYRAIVKNGKPMAMSYKTQEAIKYQKEFTKYVIEEVQKQKWEKSDNKFQHYYLDCYFYFDRTDKDANNYFKCMADAITEAANVWIDDVQLCERVQGIWYDKDNPRIEMVLREVDYIGIFKDKYELEQFEQQCNKCQRGCRNCKIRKAAKEGRIQEEVSNNICLEFKEKKKQKME